MKCRLSCAVLALALCGAAQGAIDIQQWQQSGVRVLFVETRQLPMIQVSVGFDAGSARDPVSKTGVAYLVNRMLEEGAGSLDSEDIALTFDSLGVQFDSSNGRDMSVFELRSLSDEEIVRAVTPVFGMLLSQPTFPEAAFAREKSRLLVRLEQQQQSPRDIANRSFYKQLFAGHPYSLPPNGEPVGVKNISKEDLRGFHQRYFVRRNCVLSLVGDMSRAAAERLVGEIIAELPEGAAADRIAPLPRLQGGRDVHIAFPSSQSHLLMGQLGMSRDDPDYYALYVGNHILGGSGLVSRLSDEIREQRGLAYSAYSYFLPMRRQGPFIIGLQTRTDQLELAERVARDTVARFVREGPTAMELKVAKRNITGGFPLRLDSNRKIAGQLMRIAFYDLPLDYLDRYSERISAVTLSDIKQAFKRRVDPQNLVRVVVGARP